MNSVDWVRFFRSKMVLKISSKNSWGKNELVQEIEKIYSEVLEEMISPNELGGDRK